MRKNAEKGRKGGTRGLQGKREAVKGEKGGELRVDADVGLGGSE